MKSVVSLKEVYIAALFLILISALVYLPYATQLTYYLDDWYYIYDGHVAGANIFHSMFNADRPARGYFFDVYFSLFGGDPLPYHLGVYLWRVIAGTSALLLLNILWPNNRRFSFFALLLFILYPGYSWWISAIEYQPMMASLALQIFSVVLTLMAIRASEPFQKTIYVFGAIFTGWAYIALVDYAIGMEVFRFLCVYLLLYQRTTSLPIAGLKKIVPTMKAWMWNALIPFGFIYWRLFIFENSRRSTDVGLQLAKFREAPTDILLDWGLGVGRSVATISFDAWTRQFYLRFAEAGFQISALGWIQAIGVVALLIMAASKLVDSSPGEQVGQSRRIAQEAIFLGGVSLLLGILPVVLMSRFVNLTFYSHYGLPASLASSIFLAGLIYYFLPYKHIQSGWLLALIISAVLTHSLIAQKTITLKKATEEFWWQASWRIPGLRPDTTLVTLYPYVDMVDYDLGLPEPVNLIYFPDPQNDIPIRYPVSTLMPTDKNIELILSMQGREKEGYRTHELVINYNNVLILTQPTPLSCVRVINGAHYLASENDTQNIRKIASYSQVENIRLQVEPRLPQEFAFGPEPHHSWCYFFEKADLAVQRLEWREAADFGDEIFARGLYPSDSVEWLPFIQTYVTLSDENKLRMISEQTTTDTFFENQVCQFFHQPRNASTLDLHMKNVIENLFCA